MSESGPSFTTSKLEAPAGAYPAATLPGGFETAIGPPPTGGLTAQGGMLPIKRSVLRVVVLSVLSFGLYGLYWFYVTRTQVTTELGTDDNAGLQTLGLFVPILNIFIVYWLWRDINALRSGAGLPEFSIPLYLVLALVVPFAGLVVYCLVVSQLNEAWDRRSGGRATKARYTVGEIVSVVVPAVGMTLIIALGIIAAIVANDAQDTLDRAVRDATVIPAPPMPPAEPTPTPAISGGDEPGGAAAAERGAIEASLATYLDAADEGNEMAFCGIQTTRQINDTFGRNSSPMTNCIAKAPAALRKVKVGDTSPTVTDLEVTGRRAQVVTNQGEEIGLKRENGLWKIDDVG